MEDGRKNGRYPIKRGERGRLDAKGEREEVDKENRLEETW